MNVEVGDKVSMADVRRAVVIDVVVLEVWQGGVVKVEADRSQGPEPRQFLTGIGFLLPREEKA